MAEGQRSGVTTFDLGDLYGEVSEELLAAEPSTSIRRLTDPTHAAGTLHWGRNYLYRIELVLGGRVLEAAVKQFRSAGRRGPSKAERSWRMAWAFLEAGIATPSPLAWIESRTAGGSSYYVCRHLPDVIEARYLLRARNANREERYPWCDFERLFWLLGRAARRMHDAGMVHRDLSIGNVLVEITERRDPAPGIWLVDLNRARVAGRPGSFRRARELCRLEIHREEDREALLAAYWGGTVPRAGRWIYAVSRRGYRLKHRIKDRLKSLLGRPRSLRPAPDPHPHIAPPPPQAGNRDRVVWDPLTDQPHQHAGRLARLLVRIADAPRHAAMAGAVLAAVPGVLEQLRELTRSRLPPRPWNGVGVGLRPWSEAPDVLLREVEALGLRHVLLRLHPWQQEHREEEELARELHARGLEICFGLPQNRELVRQPQRWKASIEQLAERFLPYGSTFQLGQAINRSKWGIWTYQEYLQLAALAASVLRRTAGVRLLGPAVIDFEPHATAAALFLGGPEVRFDALSSLLYVDRRGAPENRQLGLDARGKARLLRALARSSPRCGNSSWITEFNWPLREGPHSPAGRDVAVSEEEQADYLVRYLMLTLGSGEADRAYWWQLVARGYGLVEPVGARARRRPAFRALAFLQERLAASRSAGLIDRPEPERGVAFELPSGEELRVLWRTVGSSELDLPRPAKEVRSRDGELLGVGRAAVTLGPSPIYALLER